MRKSLMVSVSGMCLLLLTVFTVTVYGVGPYSNNGITVIDTATGLEWQQSDDGQVRTWTDALAYCEGLPLGGYDDWRLPNPRELDSIVDLTRYRPAIDTDYFSCQSSSYWSATTSAYYTYGAWSINFDFGTDYYNAKTNRVYVRCVRAGISGSFGQSGSFVFDTVDSPVEPETCQEVRVEARTPANKLDTGFNGDVALSVNYGMVSPNILHFTNGVGRAENNCVTIYGRGENKQLSVQGRGRYGASNYFATNTGYCTGRIEVHAHTSGATVILNKVGGGEYSRKDTNFSHVAAFDNVPCNSYTVRVEKDGYSYEEDKPLNVAFSGNTYVRSVHLPRAGAKTPVILIPGIMGSTNRGASGLQPYLKGNYPDKDIVIHLPGLTGWKKMKKTLEDDGHPVVLCPWDWRSESRESMKKNVEMFLIPAINNALNYSSTGKVDIVAHSMGGLLARAYIQSNVYRNDVSRLALVAVPNLGSADPYCLIEAGDTKTTKALVGDFYEKTIKKLWKKTYYKKHWKSCNADKIRDFLHDYGPGVYQLMHTGEFLKFNNTEYGVMQGDNVNTWLKAMNSGTSGFKSPWAVFERYDESGDKVKTRVFAGNLYDKGTLRRIETDVTTTSLYPDGQPLDYRPCSLNVNDSPSHVTWGDGDGTVLWESAVYPVTEGWADGYSKIDSRKHAFIIKDFENEIKDFLDEVTSTTSTLASKSFSAVVKTTKTTAETPELMFSVIGNMRLVVTDSLGRKSGIPAATGVAVNEISETDIEANDAGMLITISNPAAGQYSLDYYGLSDGDYSLYVTTHDTAGKENEDSFDGYRPDRQQTLVVTYDPAHADQTTVHPVVTAPSDYESKPYDCATGKCARLIWKASEGVDVTEYVIYRSLTNEPFYTELARVAAGVTSYNTGEAWDSAEGYPVNGYGVSAIKADETESFFAKDKTYTMYIFPWPMFLPAMTGTGH